VTAITGKEIRFQADTICLHGDTPGAAMIAKRVRERLEKKGAGASAGHISALTLLYFEPLRLDRRILAPLLPRFTRAAALSRAGERFNRTPAPDESFRSRASIHARHAPVVDAGRSPRSLSTISPVRCTR